MCLYVFVCVCEKEDTNITQLILAKNKITPRNLEHKHETYGLAR